MFMCRKHWFMLPKAMQNAVWAHYVPGQERRMDPTPEYLDYTRGCIEYVRLRERCRCGSRVCNVCRAAFDLRAALS